MQVSYPTRSECRDNKLFIKASVQDQLSTLKASHLQYSLKNKNENENLRSGVESSWLSPLTTFKFESTSASLYTSWSRQGVWGSSLAVLNLSECLFISYNPFLFLNNESYEDTLGSPASTYAFVRTLGLLQKGRDRVWKASHSHLQLLHCRGWDEVLGKAKCEVPTLPSPNASSCGGRILCVNYWGRSRRERYL